MVLSRSKNCSGLPAFPALNCDGLQKTFLTVSPYGHPRQLAYTREIGSSAALKGTIL